MINENFDNDKYWECNIVNTISAINTEIPDKEYILQRTKQYGYRCISHHPHYIMTEWVKSKDQALKDGDNAIEKYYFNHGCNHDFNNCNFGLVCGREYRYCLKCGRTWVKDDGEKDYEDITKNDKL